MRVEVHTLPHSVTAQKIIMDILSILSTNDKIFFAKLFYSLRSGKALTPRQAAGLAHFKAACSA